ncbi:MAG TPA: hypothetical protein VHH36_04610 [Candidatus Thermoplasmatota archaeon]|nr:hypothetical protein [Candidatus Thermoplasmatota archaeon]
MVGKNPHRPEGKAADNERMSAAAHSAGLPRQAPSDKERHELDRRAMEEGGGPTRVPAEEAIGGSRPGVESRVKDAIERREEREDA